MNVSNRSITTFYPPYSDIVDLLLDTVSGSDEVLLVDESSTADVDNFTLRPAEESGLPWVFSETSTSVLMKKIILMLLSEIATFIFQNYDNSWNKVCD